MDEIKFPKTPVSSANLEQFKNLFRLKMQHTGCDRYICDSPTLRKIKPSRSDKPKRYKTWKRDSEWIGVALKTCLMGHAEGFALVKDIRCGVKAWDILMNRYDRRIFNGGASRATDLQDLFSVTLDSTKKGSFSKFISKFENKATFVQIDGQAPSDDFKYDLLLRAIKHPSYNMFLTTVKTREPQYAYHQLIHALLVYATEIEGKDNVEIIDARSIATVSRINGYQVNEHGFTTKDQWKNMTKDQQEAFLTAKKKLQREGKIKSGNFKITDGKPTGNNQDNDDKDSDKKKKKKNANQFRS